MHETQRAREDHGRYGKHDGEDKRPDEFRTHTLFRNDATQVFPPVQSVRMPRLHATVHLRSTSTLVFVLSGEGTQHREEFVRRRHLVRLLVLTVAVPPSQSDVAPIQVRVTRAVLRAPRPARPRARCRSEQTRRSPSKRSSRKRCTMTARASPSSPNILRGLRRRRSHLHPHPYRRLGGGGGAAWCSPCERFTEGGQTLCRRSVYGLYFRLLRTHFFSVMNVYNTFVYHTYIHRYVDKSIHRYGPLIFPFFSYE